MPDPSNQRKINAQLALEYLGPQPRERVAGPLIGGLICGILAIAMSGCLALGFILGHPTPSGRHVPALPFWVFLAAIVGAVVGLVALVRSPNRKWFWIGALIGVGVMSLCEGLCFFNS